MRRREAIAVPAAAADWPEELHALAARLGQLWVALGLSDEEQAQAWASFNAEAAPGWRINPLAAPATGTLVQLQADFPNLKILPETASTAGWLPAEQREALVRHPLVAAGALYVQNLSSQWAVMALDPQPGESVLDLAAAPGSKTTQIAAAMGNSGYLAAVEPVRSRFFRLKANLERCGVSNHRLFMADGRSIGAKVPGRFDRVLIDAPCSSEARIVLGDPDSWQHWKPRKVNEAAHKQRALLESAWACLRPGGRLLYSTCSFAPEENEAVVAQLLERAPEARLLPIAPLPAAARPGLTAWGDETWPEALKLTARMVPDSIYSGFYLALIEKPEA